MENGFVLYRSCFPSRFWHLVYQQMICAITTLAELTGIALLMTVLSALPWIVFVPWRK